LDENSIEDLFERNADMRLLEHRNAEPGKATLPKKRVGSSFGAESIMAGASEDTSEKAAQLRVGIGAAPLTGVIAGAVVGVAIDVFNDGTTPAPESMLLLSLPIEAQFRTGTLRIDGREPTSPEQLFGAGLPLARLTGAASTKVTFQLQIGSGVNTLYLQPRLQATGVPIVGTSGIAIKRATNGQTAAAAQPERPFYELDDEEIAERATDVGNPILPPVLTADEIPVSEAPPAAAPVAAAPIAAAPIAEPIATAEPTVAAAPEPELMLVEPPPITARATPAARAAAAKAALAKAKLTKTSAFDAALAEVEAAGTPRKRVAAEQPAPDSAGAQQEAFVAPGIPVRAPASEERMTRYRTLGASDVALLERLFTAPVPGVIAHYIMISTLACNEPHSGDDASGFAPFLRADIESLGRALVHTRMGKASTYKVSQDDLDALALPWSVTPDLPPGTTARLRRDLRQPEWAAIGGLLQPSERDSTLRTRIALLALAGAQLEGADARAAETVRTALAAYRSAILAWLVPLCVASAGATSFVIPMPAAGVDEGGRAVVAALKAALRL
jgi:pyruvate/2-oxoglutarate dehydrogenase complex dihydrolipoamide acyltransferase (E2) component